MFPTPMLALLGLALVGAAPSVWAETPADLLAHYTIAARTEVPGFAGFSAARGRQFFESTHGDEWSCASCHTRTPTTPGRHAVTHKTIQPLAPSTNPERFTQLKKSEKWFARNCKDVLARACTTQEKGDVLAYLLSLQK